MDDPAWAFPTARAAWSLTAKVGPMIRVGFSVLPLRLAIRLRKQCGLTGGDEDPRVIVIDRPEQWVLGTHFDTLPSLVKPSLPCPPLAKSEAFLVEDVLN